MADETIPKQEYAVRNLGTRSVTLYPGRAQVIREIREITLTPGANEIVIYGLDPTIDESSIKVDGKGSATITDMTVDLVPNREVFTDVYPKQTDTEDSGETEDDQEDSEQESEIVKDFRKEQQENADSTKHAYEEKASTAHQLVMLDRYARSLEHNRPNDLEKCVSTYREERKKAYELHFSSEGRVKNLEKQRDRLLKRQKKALRATTKAKARMAKERAERLEKRRRAHQDKLDTWKRLEEDRIQFWPRKVYQIVLRLEANSDMTPASTRRGSIDSQFTTTFDNRSEDSLISLSISYMTPAAYWSPRYDLSLDTVSSSGLLTYRAEFCNISCETWKDTKVILSTSQTAFHGLGESMPLIQPWHIRLNNIPSLDGSKNMDPSQLAISTNGALLSTHETNYHQRVSNVMDSNVISKPRNNLYGLDDSYVPDISFGTNAVRSLHEQARTSQMQAVKQQQMQSAYQNQAQMQQQRLQQQQSANQDAQMQLYYLQQQQMKRQTQPQARITGDSGQDSNSQTEDAYHDAVESIIPDLPSLESHESEWLENGMTATYDIPGLRTIAPSRTMRRHKISSIKLKDVHFSHLSIPKLRAAAFLKARIRNTSNITLLKGPVGLTLDGSFLGNASLPRCNAGEPFTLSLGVDPDVRVIYGKPTVKRSQSGVFQKEGSGIYSRTCTITNTKSTKPVKGIILDQIPVSEDERLKINILQPIGLHNEGDTATSDTGVAAIGKVTEKWGSARALLKKAGEVSWNIDIEPSRGVKLVLEYEARFPSTEMVVTS